MWNLGLNGTVTEMSIAMRWLVKTHFRGNERTHNTWIEHFLIGPQQTNIKQYTRPNARAIKDRTHLGQPPLLETKT
jgi:hypothetical protein